MKDSKDMLEDALGRFPEGGAGDGGHLSMGEIGALARRRRAGEEVELPEHVAMCPVCLEMYEVVLEGVPEVSAGAMERFVAIHDRPKGRIGPWVRVAAAAVVVMGIGLWWALGMGKGTTSSVASGGTLVMDSGVKVASGESLPGGTELTAQEEARASFEDGSGIKIQQGTRLAIEESNLGSKTVVLTQGRVEASVAKQTWGRKFEVSTPLGPVTVVGTKFSVTCGKEPVVVYEGDDKKAGENREITVVTVRVTEGVVRVSNKSEEVHVRAGQVAVMREKQPRIDLGDEGK